MFNKISELASPKDFITYWQACLSKLDTIPNKDVASYMVGVMSNDKFDDLYEHDVTFAKIFELVSDLESQYNNQESVHVWDEVKRLIASLSAKY